MAFKILSECTCNILLYILIPMVLESERNQNIKNYGPCDGRIRGQARVILIISLQSHKTTTKKKTITLIIIRSQPPIYYSGLNT